MYLSKLLLDPAKRQVRLELANRYELHRTLLAQFEGQTRPEIKLLYRIEEADQNIYQPITLLVQSQVAPSWQALFQRGLLVQPVEIKTFEIQPGLGSQYYFRLLANPTIRRASGSWAGKRVEIRDAEEQKAWLARKGEGCGFKLLNMNAMDKGKISSQKTENGQKHIMQHQAVLFEGLLQVANPEMFIQAVMQGIGSAKGFGFGLLSLAKRS